jgi:hypothetical protein
MCPTTFRRFLSLSVRSLRSSKIAGSIPDRSQSILGRHAVWRRSDIHAQAAHSDLERRSGRQRVKATGWISCTGAGHSIIATSAFARIPDSGRTSRHVCFMPTSRHRLLIQSRAALMSGPTLRPQGRALSGYAGTSFDTVNFLLTMHIHPPYGAGLDGATACRGMRSKPMQTCYRRSR